MEEFLKIECPNRLREVNPTFECRHMMAGPALETLQLHDFSHPFVDTRYCSACNTFWKVTITGMDELLDLELLDGPINFVKSSKLFVGATIEGNKLKVGKLDHRKCSGK